MNATTAVHDVASGLPKDAPAPAPVAAAAQVRARPVLVGSEEDGYAPVIPMPDRRRTPYPREQEARELADGRSGSVPAGIANVKAAERAREEALLVRNMAGKIGQAAIEVLAGTRPIQQLARWLDPRSFDALMVRAALTRAAQESGHGNVRQLHRNPTVRSVHCSAVGPGIYESSLVVSEQVRQRALAMRLEQTHGVWKVTALEIG
jgi:Family of unknown function (DUF6459)